MPVIAADNPMTVDQRIDVQMELGLLQRMRNLVNICAKNFGHLPGATPRINGQRYDVAKKLTLLRQAIIATDSDDICNRHRQDLTSCHDSISTMLQAADEACATLVQYRDLSVQMTDVDGSVRLCYDDVIEMTCRLLDSVMESCLRIANLEQYSVDSILLIELNQRKLRTR